MSSVTKDALVCAVCLKPGPALDLDHIVNRGMGGSKERDLPENKITLCRHCHELKTLGKIKTWVAPCDNGLYVYSWMRAGADVAIRTMVRVDKRYGCLVPSDGAERTDGLPRVQQRSALSKDGEGLANVVSAEPSPAITGADEPSALLLVGTDRGSSAPVGGEGAQSLPPTDLRVPRRMSSPSPLSLMDAEGAISRASVEGRNQSPSAFSLTDVCQEGMRLVYWGLKLKDATDEWRWRIGDWLVQMEEDLGESAYQYFEPVKEAFGYDAIRQYKSVAERVTRVTRIPELPWSHHRAVASLDEKGQKAALLTAQEEGLSSREVAAMVRPEPPERERHRCPLCQYEHWVVVGARWKA